MVYFKKPANFGTGGVLSEKWVKKRLAKILVLLPQEQLSGI